MKTITTQVMLRFEAVLGLNLGKTLLMPSTKNLLTPTNTLGKAILEHTHTQTRTCTYIHEHTHTHTILLHHE
jgi:hypothetical protein